jgi:hypothetical protein
LSFAGLAGWHWFCAFFQGFAKELTQAFQEAMDIRLRVETMHGSEG